VTENPCHTANLRTFLPYKSSRSDIFELLPALLSTTCCVRVYDIGTHHLEVPYILFKFAYWMIYIRLVFLNIRTIQVTKTTVPKLGFKRNRNLQAETKNLPKQEFLFRFLCKPFLEFLVTVSVIGFKIFILLVNPRSSGLLPGGPKNFMANPGSFL
jgi:hypothetical protein